MVSIIHINPSLLSIYREPTLYESRSSLPFASPVDAGCYERHMMSKVVRLVTAALNAVMLAEQRWMQVINAFKEQKYLCASQLLRDATRAISDAAKG